MASDGQTPITGQLKAAPGSSLAPIYSFLSDLASGLYLPLVGSVGMVGAGWGPKATALGGSVGSAVPVNGGTNYVIGDHIILAGGLFARRAVLQVASLTGTAVASVTVLDPGLYDTVPTNPVAQLTTNGIGLGATFNLTPTATSHILIGTDSIALWQAIGATAYMAGAMALLDGAALANYIGAANLAAAVQSALPTLTPQGRLSLINSAPVITSDTVATSIFYMPYNGNLVPIFNGTIFVDQVFSLLTLALNSSFHAANNIYDVFVFMNSGVPTLASGPSWSNSGAGTSSRGSGGGTTQLQLVSGIYVNAQIITLFNGLNTYPNIPIGQATYLGSFAVDTTAAEVTGNVSYGQLRKYGLWNTYNRLPIGLKAGDPGSWSFSSPTSVWRPANNNTGNSLLVFTGLQEDWYDVEYMATASQNGSSVLLGVGFNSTTAQSGFAAAALTGGNITVSLRAFYRSPPTLGKHLYTALEQIGGGTGSFTGGEGANLLTAAWRA